MEKTSWMQRLTQILVDSLQSKRMNSLEKSTGKWLELDKRNENSRTAFLKQQIEITLKEYLKYAWRRFARRILRDDEGEKRPLTTK